MQVVRILTDNSVIYLILPRYVCKVNNFLFNIAASCLERRVIFPIGKRRYIQIFISVDSALTHTSEAENWSEVFEKENMDTKKLLGKLTFEKGQKLMGYEKESKHATISLGNNK